MKIFSFNLSKYRSSSILFLINRVVLTALFLVGASGCQSLSKSGLDEKNSGGSIENSKGTEIKKLGLNRTALEVSKSNKYLAGQLVVIQTATSENQTSINILSPRLKNYRFVVTDENKKEYPVKHLRTVQNPQTMYKVEQILVTDLSLGKLFSLSIYDDFRGSTTLVDERFFKTLDLKKTTARFATVSCMADDMRYAEVIDPIWEKLRTQQVDFIILNGDIVYVDSFDFVERKKATELDLWLRYIDSLRRMPIYHWRQLVPILATWDDHDFGTNDGDREFQSKKEALKIFRAFFGGEIIPEHYAQGPYGVSSYFKGFGQRFFFMDDRTYRQPNKNQKSQELFGHWGKEQHEWLMKELKKEKTMSWIFNGNQIFNGKAVDIKEAFEANHPKHFQNMIEELKVLKIPVVFSSGDIHFSEIMRIPKERLGYETYEISSSSMHSYTGPGWANPARIPDMFTNEFNFVTIDTVVNNTDELNMDVKSIGLADKPYFQTTLKVKLGE